MSIADTRVRLTYNSGMTIDAHYVSESEVRWHAHTGPAAGQDGAEQCQVAEVAPGMYFVNWIEAPATVLSQVLDLNTMRVTLFAAFKAGENMQGFLDRGNVEVLG